MLRGSSSGKALMAAWAFLNLAKYSSVTWWAAGLVRSGIDRSGLKVLIFVVTGGQQGTVSLPPGVISAGLHVDKSGGAIGSAKANGFGSRAVAPYKPERPMRIFLLSNFPNKREDSSCCSF